MALNLRKATRDDAETLFRWRNDSETRKNSFQTQPIVYEEHIAWLEKTLCNSKQEIYILCENNTPIGQIRLSIEADIAIVSYSIDVSYRAQGYGRVLLRFVENLCVERGMPKILRGYVKKNNTASKLIFEQLDYVCEFDSELECFQYTKRIL